MKNIKLLVIAFILSLFTTSCVVDDEADVDYGQGPYVIGFKSSVAAESYFADEGTITKTYPVDILGGSDGTATEEDVVINYEISPASTATEGEEFNFVDNSGTLTIPAGSTFVEFPLEINTGGFDPNAPTELILTLTSANSENAVVSEADNQLAITFVGCQSTLDQYQYQVTVTEEATGSTYDLGVQNIIMDDVNVFRTETTASFTPGLQGTDPDLAGLTFTDICGNLSIPDQGLFQNQFSNAVTGAGSEPVDENGNFSLRFSIGPDLGTFTQTYTRL